MIDRFKNVARRLHEDESGPGTVEWVLLIIIALIVLIVIYKFGKYALDQFQARKDELDGETSNVDPGGFMN
ncbi:MAG: hypothetical protein AAGD00_09210 [Planctomycetota bacterium]